MNVLSLLLLAPLATVKVAAGPAMAVGAVPVAAPIDEVTVYSDRAQVRRVGKVKLARGATAIRFSDLPGGVLRDTIRVRSSGAEVARVEVSTVQLERISIAQVDSLLKRLEAVHDRMAQLRGQVAVIDAALSFTDRLQPRPAVDESERVGKRAPPIKTANWTRVLDFMAAQRRALYAERAALAVKQRAVRREHDKLRREVAQFDLGGMSDRKVRVVALLTTPAARSATVEVAYFVRGAHWRPSYDLHYDSRSNRVTVSAAGIIKQATGERWDNVRLLLSTAMPHHSIHMPKLLTWTLGEAREYVPRAYPRRRPPRPPRMPGPTPRRVAAEREADARRQILAQRVAQLRRLMAARLGSGSGAALVGSYSRGGRRGGYGGGGVGDEDDEIDRLVKKPAEMRRRPPRRRPRRRPRMRAKRSYRPSPKADSAPSYRPQAAAPGRARRYSSRGASSGRARQPRRSLALFGSRAPQRRRLGDRTLPANLAGGLDYVFAVPQRTSVPSDGRALRAPFDARRYEVSAFYEATPSLKTVAFLKADVGYSGKLPILAGPANIFVNGRFTGQTRLKTTGPGGTLSLPLGADENIRLLRTIVPASKTVGVFSKEDITRYTVTIEVGNYKRRAIEIQLVDQVPKTNIEDVHIENVTLPKGAKGPDGNGVVRWQLRIPAGKTRKLVFSYDIRRPKDWRLHQ